ncbi:MAG TPA: alpha/beta fold hydrolase [Actinomycetota bacterium]
MGGLRGQVRAVRVAPPPEVPRRRWEIGFAVAVSFIALHLFVAPSWHSAEAPERSGLGGFALAAGVAAAAGGLFHRPGRVLRGTIALVAGAWATIFGLGTTVGLVWKLGLGQLTFLGAASLVSGLGLLVVGAVLILGVVPRWRRLWAIPAFLLAVYYLFAPLTIAVFLTHVPPTSIGGHTPKEKGLTYHDVVVTTSDAVRLAGWYVPSRNRAGVVVLHGSGSTRVNVMDHAQVLARAGYGVLMLDARGHGESHGVPMDFGWLQHRDVEAGVTFLARRADIDPGRIGVLGVSMGAVGALEAAVTDPRIRAVISDGHAVASTADGMAIRSDSWWNLPFYWVATTGGELMSGAEAPMAMDQAVARIGPRPVLLISGRGRDEGILNRRAAAVREGVELVEMPDVKHSQGIWRHPERWTSSVVGFLDRALLG